MRVTYRWALASGFFCLVGLLADAYDADASVQGACLSAQLYCLWKQIQTSEVWQ
jgi:hypothetical protein